MVFCLLICNFDAEMINVKQFLKDWTLPVAIVTGTVVYLIFWAVPQLDTAGDALGEVVDTVFPMMVFCTLFSTFCRIDFHQMRPHRWHVGVMAAQLLLVALNVWIIFCVEGNLWQKIKKHNSLSKSGTRGRGQGREGWKMDLQGQT